MRILLLLFLCSIAFSTVRLNPKILKKKLDEQTPAWMMEQIQSDLAYFGQSKVTKKDLDATMDETQAVPGGKNAQLVRFKIVDNKVRWFSYNQFKGDERVSHLIQFLHELARHVKLPDIEFIGSLWDCYDHPIFLSKARAPVFTICKLRQNSIAVLWPETRQLGFKSGVVRAVVEASKHNPWKKKIDKMFWRGNTMGGYYSNHNWDLKLRPRLLMLSKEHPKDFDVKFTGTYWSDPGIVKWLQDNQYIGDWSYPPDHLKYKYHLCVDGNSFASSFYWQLAGNSVIIKNRSSHIEWFYRGVRDGVHYITFDPDFHDLLDQLQWLRTHDAEAEAMSQKATAFAKEYINPETIALYFYRLFHEYAKLYIGETS